jgi:hypothetical protein
MCITFKAHKLLVDKIGNSLGIRLNRTGMHFNTKAKKVKLTGGVIGHYE